MSARRFATTSSAFCLPSYSSTNSSSVSPTFASFSIARPCSWSVMRSAELLASMSTVMSSVRMRFGSTPTTVS